VLGFGRAVIGGGEGIYSAGDIFLSIFNRLGWLKTRFIKYFPRET